MGRSMSPIKYYAASEPLNMCGGTSKYGRRKLSHQIVFPCMDNGQMIALKFVK